MLTIPTCKAGPHNAGGSGCELRDDDDDAFEPAVKFKALMDRAKQVVVIEWFEGNRLREQLDVAAAHCKVIDNPTTRQKSQPKHSSESTLCASMSASMAAEVIPNICKVLVAIHGRYNSFAVDQATRAIRMLGVLCINRSATRAVVSLVRKVLADFLHYLSSTQAKPPGRACEVLEAWCAFYYDRAQRFWPQNVSWAQVALLLGRFGRTSFLVARVCASVVSSRRRWYCQPGRFSTPDKAAMQMHQDAVASNIVQALSASFHALVDLVADDDLDCLNELSNEILALVSASRLLDLTTCKHLARSVSSALIRYGQGTCLKATWALCLALICTNSTHREAMVEEAAATGLAAFLLGHRQKLHSRLLRSLAAFRGLSISDTTLVLHRVSSAASEFVATGSMALELNSNCALMNMCSLQAQLGSDVSATMSRVVAALKTQLPNQDSVWTRCGPLVASLPVVTALSKCSTYASLSCQERSTCLSCALHMLQTKPSARVLVAVINFCSILKPIPDDTVFGDLVQVLQACRLSLSSAVSDAAAACLSRLPVQAFHVQAQADQSQAVQPQTHTAQAARPNAVEQQTQTAQVAQPREVQIQAQEAKAAQAPQAQAAQSQAVQLQTQTAQAARPNAVEQKTQKAQAAQPQDVQLQAQEAQAAQPQAVQPLAQAAQAVQAPNDDAQGLQHGALRVSDSAQNTDIEFILARLRKAQQERLELRAKYSFSVPVKDYDVQSSSSAFDVFDVVDVVDVFGAADVVDVVDVVDVADVADVADVVLVDASHGIVRASCKRLKP